MFYVIFNLFSAAVRDKPEQQDQRTSSREEPLRPPHLPAAAGAGCDPTQGQESGQEIG